MKNKNNPIPLGLIMILFGCVWYMFIVFSVGFFQGIYYTIITPTALNLFMLPIIGAVWFIFGFLTIVLANHLSKGFRKLKKKNVRRKKRK